MNTDTYRIASEPFTAEVIPITFRSPPFYEDVSCNLATGGFTTSFEHYTPNSSKDHHIWKNFEHYKAWSSRGPVGTAVTFSSDSWDGTGYHYGFGTTSVPGCFYDGCFGDVGLYNKGLTDFYWPGEEVGFIPPPAELDDLLRRGFDHCIPFIRKDMSLINSIIELKDFRSLPNSLRRYKNTLLAWRFWFSQFQNRWAAGESLASLVRSGADIYLQEKFNVAPLVSDISAIYSAYSEYDRRLNDAMSRAGRPHLGHYTRALNESQSFRTESIGPSAVQASNASSGYWSSNCVVNGQVTRTREVMTSPSVFHYQLDYSFFYSQFQTEHARLLGILDKLGLNLNPGIIWNALPWSFVLDWVVGVSRLLDQAAMRWMDPSVCLRRALWSISRQRQISVRQTFVFSTDSVGGKLPPQYNQLPTVIEKSYRRQLFNPLGTAASLTTSGLNFIELSLASALVITSRRRNRRRRR